MLHNESSCVHSPRTFRMSLLLTQQRNNNTDITLARAERFTERVQQLRAQYECLRDRSNLFGPSSKPIIDILTERVDGQDIESFLLRDGALVQFIRLFDKPHTSSGDILRLNQNLPDISGSFEIDSDAVRHIDNPPPLPEYDDDTEDMTSALASLPTIQVDPSKHHIKRGKHKSEIDNLLRCQGGSCPGSPISPHITHLLGKSTTNELVFKKLAPRYLILHRFCSLQVYKQWMIDLVTAVKALHAHGIVHRDLHIENLLFSNDGQRLVVADLECRWGLRWAPEIVCDDGNDSGWTRKSDICDVGTCIQCLIYANVPVTRQVEWAVPAPFDGLVGMCKRSDPEGQPSAGQLLDLLEGM